MAEALKWRRPLADLGRDRYASGGGAILLEDRSGLVKLLLRGKATDNAFLEAAQNALGLDLPCAPNRSAEGVSSMVYWTQPDEWLLACAPGAADVIRDALQAANLIFTDVTDGRAALRLSGTRSTDLLRKGTSLNLHPRVFEPGHCAQGKLAQCGVLLSRPGKALAYDIFCERSFAEYLWFWLEDAAREFG